eukprot:TRINITY_DN37157_c0_g1_i2.p4 TRINITY_DN37157_c0_g1~~TRINITY_DN37157_c0_g1_i2.p4  ORF type:complete len:115 (-),score=12.55 TRINITY_DN37157_c0_g1_i2:369-713(-)
MSNSGADTNTNIVPQQEEQKPNVDGGNSGAVDDQTITLKVVGQDKNEIVFKVKYTTPFKKVFTAYCQRVSQDPGVVRFVFDGRRIQDTDTPSGLEMENDDIIEVHILQMGGQAS